MIGMSGHLHDVDITNASPCTDHCPAQGNGIAVSAELVGGNSERLLRADPAEQLAAGVADRRDAVPLGGLLRHAVGRRRQYRGHLDTMSQCGITSDLLPGPTGRGLAGRRRVPVDRGIRSTRARRSGSTASTRTTPGAADRRDGDHDGLVRAARSPGYPRPKGATPLRASLVPAYNQCTSPNRVHGPPDFPGNGSNPDGSCNPPAQTSGQLTVGTPGRQRRGAPTRSAPCKVDAVIAATPAPPPTRPTRATRSR